MDKILTEGEEHGEAFREIHGEPRFVKLVDIVIQQAKSNIYNIHVEPYINSCNICSFNYTVISKMETMREDMEMILNLAGIDLDILDNKPLNRKIGDSIKETTMELFSEITKEMGEALENIYRYDLEMFGYDAQVYLSVTQE